MFKISFLSTGALLLPTALAGFISNSSSNVAVYWGKSFVLLLSVGQFLIKIQGKTRLEACTPSNDYRTSVTVSPFPSFNIHAVSMLIVYRNRGKRKTTRRIQVRAPC